MGMALTGQVALVTGASLGIWEMVREHQPEVYKMARHSAPSRRLGTPKEIADAAFCVVSPLAGWANGAAKVVDGGQSKATR